MKYSLGADIMYVGVGKTGPIWPETEGILEAMELAKENGLDMIEFFGWEGRDLEKIRQRSIELNIPVLSVVAKNGSLAGVKGKEEAFFGGLMESIPAAKALGAKALVVNCNDAKTETDREAALERIADELKEAAASVTKAGIEIWLEPISGEFFRSSKEAITIIDTVGSDNVRLLFDIYHMQMIEGNICNTIRDNLDRIGHIHGAGAPARCELTVGELNYPYILQFLKDIGYERDFGLEFFTFENRRQKVSDSCSILI